MTDRIDLDRLRLSPLFVGLRDEEIRGLLSLGKDASVAAGYAVVEEGAPGDALYLLCDGEVRVEKEVEDGPPVELAVLGEPGDFFGEMVFVDVMPRSATVRATCATRLLAFPLEVLRAFFVDYGDAHHAIVLNIARELSRRLRQADAVIASLRRD